MKKRKKINFKGRRTTLKNDKHGTFVDVLVPPSGVLEHYQYEEIGKALCGEDWKSCCETRIAHTYWTDPYEIKHGLDFRGRDIYFVKFKKEEKESFLKKHLRSTKTKILAIATLTLIFLIRACVSDSCTPGDRQCGEDDIVEVCNKSNEWKIFRACHFEGPNGSLCEKGACVSN